MISRYGLNAVPYNAELVDVTWEICTLRAWLNSDFLSTAFSPEEQETILVTEVDNSIAQGYSGWDTDGGNNTHDRIFLLSYAEANLYLDVTSEDKDNIKARVAPTAYAVSKGTLAHIRYQTENGSDAGNWWLRSPGGYQPSVACVLSVGFLSFDSSISENNMKVLAMLAAAGNFAIDAVKTGASIELPKGIEKQLRKLDKAAWWKYAHQTEDHPYTDSEYWDAELAQPGNGAIDRIGRIVRNTVPAKAELNITADPNLWAKMVTDPCRKTVIGVVDAFKDAARRNASEWKQIFRKRPDLRENWEEAAVIADKKLIAARAEIVAAAKGDVMGAYDTIARALFKYPAETAFKRFFWSVFGDIAAEVIKSNLEKAVVAA